jgi:3-hydroxyisobutyrate dehydrogenase-like beta-hydroxyacid dehydrogenase
MTDYLVPRLLRGEFEPGFAIELQLKDHRLASGLAAQLGVDLPLNELAVRLYEASHAGGLARRDVSAVIAAATHPHRNA